jgi:hypothetical protein
MGAGAKYRPPVRKKVQNMSKQVPARTTPKIAGSPVYGRGELLALPGNIVFKHNQKYHVFVGTSCVLTTPDMQVALAEAARAQKP